MTPENGEKDVPPSLAGLGAPVHFAAGSVLFRPGDRCAGLLVVTAGAVRVQLVSETGRQITLYRVESDVACVLSTQCLLTGGTYPAEGIAETDVSGFLLRAADVQRLIQQDGAFRGWLFGAYGTRLADLVLLVEDMLETNIDRRLAQHMVEAADGAGLVKSTHQAIAAELGTAREVVSRHLKDFERRGAVTLGRGAIVVLRRDLLQRWAGGASV
jgi:CRP/FNR family transcriptional regulator